MALHVRGAALDGVDAAVGVAAVVLERLDRRHEHDRARRQVADAADSPADFRPIYDLDDPIDTKIEKICLHVYGADGVVFLPPAQEAIKRFTEQELDRIPVCMAKTHLSLSHDPALLNAPSGFTVTVRDIRAYTGAGWLVALCGDMQTMPGLSATPAAFNVDIDAEGRTIGLF